jgi:hypothetical protein
MRYMARGPIVEAEALQEDPWTGIPLPLPCRALTLALTLSRTLALTLALTQSLRLALTLALKGVNVDVVLQTGAAIAM